LRAPDREGEGEGDKDDQQESKTRISPIAAEFILSRKDCVYEIIFGFVSWQLFNCSRLVPIARYY
jgi:hypothetical protein